MKKLAILFISLFFSLSSFAEIVEVETVGEGKTYEKAVNEALAEAVRQVNGTVVFTQSELHGGHIKVEEKLDAKIVDNISADAKAKAQKDDRSFFRKIIDWFKSIWASIFGGSSDKEPATKPEVKQDDKSVAEKEVLLGSINAEYEGKVSTGIEAQTDVSSAGLVKGYTVKSRECNDQGCKVTLLVKINKIERKADSAALKRERIAVVTTGNKRNTNFAIGLRDAITNNIVQSQRYTVLSRTAANARAFDQEEQFLEGRIANSHDLTESTLATDYILSIDVGQAGVRSKTTRTDIELTGESYTTTKSNTNVVVRYSLLEAATRAIVWSDSISFNAGGSVLNTANSKITTDISNRIINKLNPIYVINVKDNLIYINRGEGAVKLNDKYDIYSLGEELTDPVTGEKLGATETYAATVSISNVAEKYSVASIESGSSTAVVKGAVLRPAKIEGKAEQVQQQPAKKRKPANNDQKLGQGSGVIL